jgi:hypothetical protein
MWGPIIAAGISLFGSIWGSSVTSDAQKEQIKATKEANATQNAQWAKEFKEKKSEADRAFGQKDREDFLSQIQKTPELRKSMLDIWSGK